MGQASHLYELWGENTLILNSWLSVWPLIYNPELTCWSCFAKCTAEPSFIKNWQPDKWTVDQIWSQCQTNHNNITDTSHTYMAFISQHARTRPYLLLVPAGSFCAIRSEGALLEGVWVQAQLQWPRRHQMGAVHRPLRHLRNSLLKFDPPPPPGSDLPTFLPSPLLRFFSSTPPSSYFVSLSLSLLPAILIASLILPSHRPHPFLTRCWRLNLHHKKKVNMV